MATYYVIRNGFNLINQPVMQAEESPKNKFTTGYSKVVEIVEAESAEEAIKDCRAICHEGQKLWAIDKPGKHRWLTWAIRAFERRIF